MTSDGLCLINSLELLKLTRKNNGNYQALNCQSNSGISKLCPSAHFLNQVLLQHSHAHSELNSCQSLATNGTYGKSFPTPSLILPPLLPFCSH